MNTQENQNNLGYLFRIMKRGENGLVPPIYGDNINATYLNRFSDEELSDLIHITSDLLPKSIAYDGGPVSDKYVMTRPISGLYSRGKGIPKKALEKAIKGAKENNAYDEALDYFLRTGKILQSLPKDFWYNDVLNNVKHIAKWGIDAVGLDELYKFIADTKNFKNDSNKSELAIKNFKNLTDEYLHKYEKINDKDTEWGSRVNNRLKEYLKSVGNLFDYDPVKHTSDLFSGLDEYINEHLNYPQAWVMKILYPGWKYTPPATVKMKQTLRDDAEYGTESYKKRLSDISEFKNNLIDLNNNISEREKLPHFGFSTFGLADPLYSLEYIGDGGFGYDASTNLDPVVYEQIDKVPNILKNKYNEYFAKYKGDTKKAFDSARNDFETGAYQVKPGYKFYKYPYLSLLRDMYTLANGYGDSGDFYLVETPLEDVIKYNEIGKKYISQRNSPNEIVTKSIKPIKKIGLNQFFKYLKREMDDDFDYEDNDENEIFAKKVIDKMSGGKQILSDKETKKILSDYSNWYSGLQRQNNIINGITGDLR